MRPEATEEQVELKASVERFWRDEISPERLAAWADIPAGIDGGAWDAIRALGWIGIGIPTERGGSGLTLIEVACVVEECARGLVPLRVIRAIRGASILAAIDPSAPELTDLADGSKTVTLAIDERQARRPENFTTVIDAAGTISGEKWCVPDPTADWHLVAGAGASGVGLALVEGAAAAVDPLRAFDGAEQGTVRYDNVRSSRIVAEASRGAEVLTKIRRIETALALAEMLGGMTAALDATVAYVQEREQFGQKIGVFQAVQHQVADMALAKTASRHLAWQAISRLANGTEQGVELETAAAYVARSFKDITMTAHHLHGGAGYVVEHTLHFHSERAQSLSIRYAPEAEALAAVAAALLDE